MVFFNIIGFKGGLDVKTQTTGEYSIYRNFRGIEIMYHVSTLLPYESTKSTSEEIHASSNSSKTSKTQHIRKKFIGNNICAIVFYDGDTSFAVDTIATNTCQVFAVIRPIINSRNDTENGSSKENQNGSDVIGYSLSLCMKNGNSLIFFSIII